MRHKRKDTYCLYVKTKEVLFSSLAHTLIKIHIAMYLVGPSLLDASKLWWLRHLR
jgi:hypothetical protein